MRGLRVLQRVPGVALKQTTKEKSAALFDPARPLKGENMKALQTVFSVLAWIAVGFALWAIFPVVMKLIGLLTKLHDSWL